MTYQRILCGVSALALGFPMMAQAQTVAATGTQTESSSTALQEVVVTAQKRDETLQKTAAAVQVVGAAQLVDRGVSDFSRITNVVTGLSISPTRQGVVVFSRGLGQSDTQSQTPVAVEVELDGLTLPKDAQQFAFFDVANVQVLKGPQGTLYGRNAVGGAVLVSSKRPTFGGFSADGYFEYGNYDSKHAFVGANVPLGSEFAVRAAVDYLDHDGYLSTGANSADTISGRLSAAAKPTDRLSILISGTYSHRTGNGYAQSTVPYDTAANGSPFYVSPVPASGVVAGINFNDPHNHGFDRSEAYLITGELKYALTDQLEFSYITGYFNYKSAETNAWSYRPLGVYQASNAQYFTEDTMDFQNEARLSYTRGKTHVIVGALQHDFDSPTTVRLSYPLGLNVNGPYDYGEKNYAVFGDAEVALTDRFRLEGGVRQSWDSKTLTGLLSLTPVTLNSSNFPGWSHFSWKIGAEYDLSSRILAYANIQNGYLPGSFNSASPATLAGANVGRRYNQETVTSYTAGLKSRFLADRLQVNLEAFYYDYGNFQVNQRINVAVPPATNFQSVYNNVKKSRIIGADADIAFRLTANDTLTAGLSLLDAEIVDTGFTSLAVLQSTGFYVNVANPSLKGYQLPNSPNVTVNLGYEHVFPLAHQDSIVANVATHIVSSQWLDYTHPQVGLAQEPAYSKTDVSLTYRAPGNRWNVSAFGRNLENSATYATFSANPFRQGGPGTPITGAFGAGYPDIPRTYGVRIGFTY